MLKIDRLSKVMQPTNAYMTHVIESNVTTTYMVIFEDKYTQIIILFTCYMIEIVLLIDVF